MKTVAYIFSVVAMISVICVSAFAFTNYCIGKAEESYHQHFVDDHKNGCFYIVDCYDSDCELGEHLYL